MYAVGHQTVRPHLDARLAAPLGEEIEVQGVILVGEEHRHAAVAALGDVMAVAGNDEAGDAGHRASYECDL